MAGDDAVALVVQQLRRSAPGGIGTYCTGLLQGLRQLAAGGRSLPSMMLVAGRAGRHARDHDPLTDLGWPVRSLALPGPVLTRLWDRGLGGLAGDGVVHALSLAAPPPRHRSLVVTVHDLTFRTVPEAFPRRGRAWHEHAFARATRNARYLVVPSAVVADDVVAAGVEPQRVVVIEHGGDHVAQPDLAGADELLCQLGVREPFVLAVGTVEPRKNLRRLVAAHDRARSQVGEPFPLVVVGPSGWGTDPPASTATVVLTGPVAGPVLSGLYRRARLLAYVPLAEGYGLPPLEAMALGTPVVASPVPSTGGAAWEVDPSDVDAITAGIVTVATDEAIRQELQSAGLRRARARTWAVCAEEHLAVWTEAL